MGGENGTPSRFVELLEQLEQEPFAFDFFQAIRLLDCARPDKPQTGHSSTLTDDSFRLGQEPSMAFAPATVAELEAANDYHPPRLISRFLGLLGPQGPLPLHLTRYAYSRIHHHHDHTFMRFLDVFHHRMLALFYKSWSRVRPTVNFDRGSKDRFGEYVESLFGLGMPSLVNRDALADLPKRHFSGLLSCQTKNAAGLLAILRGYFGLPAEIGQFVGQWIELPGDCCCRMGVSPDISKLGETITIGSHVWDCQQKFRLILGPLTLADFFNLLPGSVEVLEPQGTPPNAKDSGQSLSPDQSTAKRREATTPANDAHGQPADTIYKTKAVDLEEGRTADELLSETKMSVDDSGSTQPAQALAGNSTSGATETVPRLQRQNAGDKSPEDSAADDPSGKVSLDSLVALVRGYVGDELQWDVQLILQKEETPPMGLGIQGHLGWSSWLMRDKMQEHAEDLVLDAMGARENARVTKLERQKIPYWDDQTLGQLRDGTLVPSSEAPD